MAPTTVPTARVDGPGASRRPARLVNEEINVSEFRFLHDIEQRTVYKIPSELSITEQKNSRGKRTGWHATAQIEITRADNVLRARWKYPVRSHPIEHYDARYERFQLTSFFWMHNEPSGESISEEEYESLRERYDRLARQNRA